MPGLFQDDKPRSTWYRVVVVGMLLALGTACARTPGSSTAPAKLGPECTLDQALGRNGRESHANTLTQRRYGGKVHTWDQFANWGAELVSKGYVAKSPINGGQSPKLSQHYRCVHCHNLAREDNQLTLQDPEARGNMIRGLNPKQPEKRDGGVLSLTPGTTLWGAVNREEFYNGYYAKYRDLPVASGNKMNPRSLADAVDLCCRFCSGGRFPEAWERDSILAFLWDQELKLSDLNLPQETLDQVLDQLNSNDAEKFAKARSTLRGFYLIASRADLADLPEGTLGTTDLYANGKREVGNAGNGKLLYLSACAGCHGQDVHKVAGADLAKEDKRFHKFVLKGTERDGAYMPFFTKQRLSPRQLADIRAYLQTP